MLCEVRANPKGSRQPNADAGLCDTPRFRLWSTEDLHACVVRTGAITLPERIWQSRWYNAQRLLEPIGNIPPVEHELTTIGYKEARSRLRDSIKTVSGIPGAVHLLTKVGWMPESKVMFHSPQMPLRPAVSASPIRSRKSASAPVDAACSSWTTSTTKRSQLF